MQEVIYQLKEYRSLTPHVTEIFLKPKFEAFRYRAGQYTKVIQPDGSLSPLSIANAPTGDGLIEFHLLHTPENFRANAILQQLKGTGEIRLRGPYGVCTAERLLPQKSILFLARGTGFAPMKAVIEELIGKSDYPPMHLYWSVAGWRDLYKEKLVEQWVKTLNDFHFTAVLSREVPLTQMVKSGKIPDVVLQDYPNLHNFQVYASGPEAMIYASLEGLQAHGLPRECFYSDLFDYVHE